MRLKSVRDRDLLRLSTAIEWFFFFLLFFSVFCMNEKEKKKTCLFLVLLLLLSSLSCETQKAAKKTVFNLS